MLFPLERVGVLVISGNEIVNVLPQLLGAGETGGSERLAAENAEPDFNLVEPAGASRGEMKMDPWMSGQPTVLFGFVDVQVI